ncbi:acetylglutamate kinase [Bacillus sp. DTU_2020_1000418_1_SI_GHA_SEK_038]|uniref:acetylglutamate kinase n=1 Tax=Bacillus sp. DTU_2020_1000418_1_SI_GHA_SEK_038 TaxID=3077585 RepID=UPI0028E4C1FB|nr:acetylglutamate kinase [Bacillus sp. DTU_2020_1000418_1_SI_GHA_SEK_038]WNS76847.1 acetylglutamate kinase [Bacillus sp. DTU_2020_1000418_1_SI_GHA_SEK_038]
MKTIVIKCGGSVLDELTPDFFESLIDLDKQGYKLIFVHGGGPDINKMLDLFQVPHEFVQGLRKTTSQALEIVEMVLSGQTNRKLVAKLQSYGLKGFGLNGSDGEFLQGEFIDKEQLGFVGDVTRVNKEVITMLLQDRFIPVITPIAVTEDGTKLNINADFAAAAVANALEVEHCIFVTDVDGIMIDGNLLLQTDTEEIDKYIDQGQITGGMIPKVKSAAASIEKGIKSVMIVSGKKKFFDGFQWIGTEINAKERVLK